ncbi:hypothetical protein GF340_00875 [Candidatus Peregrinibacteria bacterium]|nr:hypothetical protein [Candidatus Peregrinibacteria bacterium]
MAKRPVQKWKAPKARTRSRYASYAAKKIKKLQGIVDGAKHTFKKAEDIQKEDNKAKAVEKINKVKA